MILRYILTKFYYINYVYVIQKYFSLPNTNSNKLGLGLLQAQDYVQTLRYWRSDSFFTSYVLPAPI